MIDTRVREVRRETAHAATLRLEVEAFTHLPGQYVKIDPHQFEAIGPAVREREAKRGRPEGPGYFSLSSDGTDPGLLEITVKAGPSTAAPLPQFLVRDARPGLRIAIDGPAGRYCLPSAPPPDVRGFLHLCAGSGVAPNRGMIRHALARGWPQRHVLVLQERTEEDVLFLEEWRGLSDRILVRFVYSSRGEYVTPDIVRQAIGAPLEAELWMAFLCGPNAPRNGEPGFVDVWKTKLRETVGFAPGRIVTEG